MSAQVGSHVVDFCKARSSTMPKFPLKDLRSYVAQRDAAVAPDSPSRILRALRDAGQVDYVVTSRPKSEYLIRGVAA
ncbi:MAG: hypothetical protein IT424_00720 [Pirellulales bacterium]|nr:hypothetical protein [Pirellulales bacterium]